MSNSDTCIFAWADRMTNRTRKQAHKGVSDACLLKWQSDAWNGEPYGYVTFKDSWVCNLLTIWRNWLHEVQFFFFLKRWWSRSLSSNSPLFSNPKIHYVFHKSLTLDPFLRQKYCVLLRSILTIHHIPLTYILIHSHLRIMLSSGSASSGFPTKILCAFLISFMRTIFATCLAP
jgi:hypothetical protein